LTIPASFVQVTYLVPEDYEIVSMIPLGYPAKDPEAPKRRDISEFTLYDKF